MVMNVEMKRKRTRIHEEHEVCLLIFSFNKNMLEVGGIISGQSLHSLAY